MDWLIEHFSRRAGLTEAKNDPIKPLSDSEVKKLDKTAKEFGGKRIQIQKTMISPGNLQPDIDTWAFSNEGDAEEFDTYAADEMGLRSNSFKYKGKYAVEVYR